MIALVHFGLPHGMEANCQWLDYSTAVVADSLGKCTAAQAGRVIRWAKDPV